MIVLYVLGNVTIHVRITFPGDGGATGEFLHFPVFMPCPTSVCALPATDPWAEEFALWVGGLGCLQELTWSFPVSFFHSYSPTLKVYLWDSLGLKTLLALGSTVRCPMAGIARTAWHSNLTLYETALNLGSPENVPRDAPGTPRPRDQVVALENKCQALLCLWPHLRSHTAPTKQGSQDLPPLLLEWQILVSSTSCLHLGVAPCSPIHPRLRMGSEKPGFKLAAAFAVAPLSLAIHYRGLHPGHLGQF